MSWKNSILRPEMKTPLSGMLPEEIYQVSGLDKPYRALQIFKAVHSSNSTSVITFNEITTLPLQMRESLSENFTLMESGVDQVLEDEENNGKLSIVLNDNRVIECVLLSDSSGRKTACLSTQAGCAMGCLFCKTGEGGFYRNLTASEITEQFTHLENNFGHISNIVFMGMGEPLENIDNLFKAAAVLNHREGRGLSFRRMTLSTCGLADKIKIIADSGPDMRLAVSLNTADQEKREKIMPIARQFGIEELKKALVYYQQKRDKRITIEYVLISGFNTADDDAALLRRFCSGLSTMVNLIPWNPAPGLDFKTPSQKEIQKFCGYLDANSIQYALRRRKAQKIRGACGQLASGESDFTGN